MSKKRLLGTLLSVIITVYILFGFYLYTFQNKFLYPADKTAFDICPELEKSEKISAGLFRGYFTKRSEDKVIVYYHGNGGRACDRSFMDSFFGELGYSTLFVEYPGYAEIGVLTSMENILDEVLLVNEFINNKKFKDIVVVSESVGTGPSAYHARLPGSNISKLILITPYNDMAGVAFRSFPLYPMSILVKDNFTPGIWLRSSTVPITVILAENDEVIGMKEGKKLFKNIVSENKQVRTIKEAGHNSIYQKPDLYLILKESTLSGQNEQINYSPQAGSAPLNVNFYLSRTDGDDDGVYYTIVFGDGEAGGFPRNSISTISHTYKSSGTYKAVVTRRTECSSWECLGESKEIKTLDITVR